jgi:hypothetical protein
MPAWLWVYPGAAGTQYTTFHNILCSLWNSYCLARSLRLENAILTITTAAQLGRDLRDSKSAFRPRDDRDRLANLGVQRSRDIEMSWVTGSKYLGYTRLDRSHLVSSYHTTNYTLYVSELVISLGLAEMLWILTIAGTLIATKYHIFTSSSGPPAPITMVSHEFHLDCHQLWERGLMMPSLHFRFTVSPHMETKCGVLFRRLSTELLEPPPQDVMGKYEEKRQMNATYPASGAQCQ